MPLLLYGESQCPLCWRPVNRGDDFVGTPYFVLTPADPMAPYADATIHRRCFVDWPNRERFLTRVNRRFRGKLTIKPDGSIKLDGSIQKGRYPDLETPLWETMRGDELSKEEWLQATSDAAVAGNEKLLDQLLQSNPWELSRVDATDLLAGAIGFEQVRCASLLIDQGADLEDVRYGVSALELVIDIIAPGVYDVPLEYRDVGLILLLLGAGADPRPGLEMARFYKFQKVVDLIEAWIETDPNRAE